MLDLKGELTYHLVHSSYFIDGKSEAQIVEMTCSKPHGKELVGARIRIRSRCFWSRASPLAYGFLVKGILHGLIY